MVVFSISWICTSQDQRLKLRDFRKNWLHVGDVCQCGSDRCTGWITLPPRAALLEAEVPDDVVKDLWMDEPYSRPVDV